MTAPRRIQRKRTRGWRMPPNSVYIGRGSRWGNPFVVGKDGTAEECVRKFADDLLPYRHHGPNSNLFHLLIGELNMRELRTALRGKNLACWCKVGEPCHGDLLLEWANNP